MTTASVGQNIISGAMKVINLANDGDPVFRRFGVLAGLPLLIGSVAGYLAEKSSEPVGITMTLGMLGAPTILMVGLGFCLGVFVGRSAGLGHHPSPPPSTTVHTGVQACEVDLTGYVEGKLLLMRSPSLYNLCVEFGINPGVKASKGIMAFALARCEGMNLDLACDKLSKDMRN